MSNVISSAVFCLRNVGKAESGDIGRGPVAAAQAVKVGKVIANYHNTISDGSKGAVSVFSKLADKSTAVKYTGKALDWASRNVNPLICISSGIKVAASNDKLTTGIKEGAAIAGMFAGEGMMKLYLDDFMKSGSVTKFITKLEDIKYLKPLFEKIAKAGCGNKISAIIKGLLFVGGSITSYAIGAKLGDNLAHEVNANLGRKPAKINQKA